jgi:hypothetical protein
VRERVAEQHVAAARGVEDRVREDEFTAPLAHFELHYVDPTATAASYDASVLAGASALAAPCPIRWKPSHAVAHTVPGRADACDGHRAIARNSCSIVG